MKKTTLILALLFSILIVSAQDKYEYMVIEYNYLLKNEIQISIDGKQYIEEKGDYSPSEKATHNVNPLLKKVSEYEAKDWELMNFETVGISTQGVATHFAYLRKKKSDKK